jgi:hypothetical protein
LNYILPIFPLNELRNVSSYQIMRAKILVIATIVCLLDLS